MKSPAVRITLAAVIVCLIAALTVPAMAVAADVVEADTPAAEALACVETSASPDAVAGAESDDTSAAADFADSAAPESREPSETDVPMVAAGTGTAVQYTILSTASTRAAIEALLKARKLRFDKVTAELKRTIDRLATDIRLEGAQGGNVAAEKAQLARARAALQRAYALERTVTARYRAVVTADDQRAQYEKAKAAARTSTAQLVTVTKLLRNLVSSARLVAVLQPLRLGADSA